MSHPLFIIINLLIKLTNKHLSIMKKFIFVVTLATGFVFTCEGEGFNKDAALMDACERLAISGEYPEDEIEGITLA